MKVTHDQSNVILERIQIVLESQGISEKHVALQEEGYIKISSPVYFPQMFKMITMAIAMFLVAIKTEALYLDLFFGGTIIYVLIFIWNAFNSINNVEISLQSKSVTLETKNGLVKFFFPKFATVVYSFDEIKCFDHDFSEYTGERKQGYLLQLKTQEGEFVGLTHFERYEQSRELCYALNSMLRSTR